MMSHKDIEEWQVEIKKKSGIYGIDELILYIAPKKKVNFVRLKDDLKNKIISETEITPQIVKVELKELLKSILRIIQW